MTWHINDITIYLWKEQQHLARLAWFHSFGSQITKLIYDITEGTLCGTDLPKNSGSKIWLIGEPTLQRYSVVLIC